MATVEHEQLIRSGISPPREHHVFVSADGRRQRFLWATGLVAGALALVWLVALGLALGGSTRLPGLPVPGAKLVAAQDAAAAAIATSAPTRSHARAHVARARTATPQRLEPPRAAAPASPVRTTAPAPPISSATPAAPVTAVTSTRPQAEKAATPTQGWARRGWTTPPGQTKRTQAAPRGRGTTASTTHGNSQGKKD